MEILITIPRDADKETEIKEVVKFLQYQSQFLGKTITLDQQISKQGTIIHVIGDTIEEDFR